MSQDLLSTEAFQFDANSYFDDWFNDDVKTGANEGQGAEGEALVNIAGTNNSQQICEAHNHRPYSTKKPHVYLEEDDGLSYDHYELMQADGKPLYGQSETQDELQPGDVLEKTPFLKESRNSSSEGKMSFDVNMPDEETSRRARWCLLCLKSYCVIFIITVLCLSAYIAVDSSTGTVGDGDELEPHRGDESGYKELRLGNRRIFYRVMDSRDKDDMAKHSALLVHGNSQNGDVFKRTGTMSFLSEHGVRAVAVDIIGYGRSDPPIHVQDSYEAFFEEVIQLFDLEYNLILVCVEEGCDKITPYYLHKGVYNKNNSFIEGAVYVSPRGSHYSQYVQPKKFNLPTAVRTLVVNGEKDAYINTDVNTHLKLVPRSELHELPDMRNSFYLKSGKTYFHAALQAFIEGLEYTYDEELSEISQKNEIQAAKSFNNAGNNGMSYGGDLFAKFQQKQTHNDFAYDPANRFSNIQRAQANNGK